MEFTVKKYPRVSELVRDIKCALNSYSNHVMFHLLSKRLSREELKQYLGKTLDDDHNRGLMFRGGSPCKTLRLIFTQKWDGEVRRKLFVELLLEYDGEVYGALLADMNT